MMPKLPSPANIHSKGGKQAGMGYDLARRGTVPPGFYSPLVRLIQSVSLPLWNMGRKERGKQIWQKLESSATKGEKEEMWWARLEEYLMLGGEDGKPGRMLFTRDAVARYMARNGVVLEDWIDGKYNRLGGQRDFIEFTMPGGVNCNVLGMRFPAAERKFVSEHFYEVPGGTNLIWFATMTDRVNADGEPGIMIEELQSDVHRLGGKIGYRSRIGYQPAGRPPYQLINYPNPYLELNFSLSA